MRATLQRVATAGNAFRLILRLVILADLPPAATDCNQALPSRRSAASKDNKRRGTRANCADARELHGLNRAGATGLEPATSGVTGRNSATGYDRRRPGITGWSRHFSAERTGCDRLRPAATW